jgi:SAM-dependent methyltransferase
LLGRVLIDWVGLAIGRRRWPDDELWVRALYRVALGREPEPAGMGPHVDALNGRATKRVRLLEAFMESPEFRERHGLAPAHPPYLEALHRARVSLVREQLPPAARIVDLGGAGGIHEGGALLEMGYPHRPREITIVDLPPTERFGGGTRERDRLVTKSGVRVHWVYSSMTDLSAIPSGEADLVWSGQSIEHIGEADADVVCREAYRILRPGGRFCLDTPNAALTRLQLPDSLIHPEHQKEYRVGELATKLERAGFRVVAAKALCPMPESARSGQFDPDEIVRNAGVTDEAEVGYLFYLEGLKPEG